MKRQNLSLKTVKTTPKCIINYWFDILEETIENLGLKERPDLIWNVDESVGSSLV